jgi:glycosyltransferase involved in cell wall biosynthesis
MRIAIFHNLPSGGGKRALYEWTRRLAATHTIEVFSLDTADHDFCDLRPYVSAHKIYHFSPRELFQSPFGRLNQMQRWRDLNDLDVVYRHIAMDMDKGGYDLVFANTCKYTFIPSLLEYVNVPSAYYLHEPFGNGFVRHFERPYLSRSRWRDTIDRFDPFIWLYQRQLASMQKRSVQKTTRLLANSMFTRNCMQSEFGVDADISSCGVDLADFFPESDPSQVNYVTSVGEMSPRKGFDFVVESIGTIPATQRPILKLACNSVKEDELAYVKDLAAQRGVQLEILVGLQVDELRCLYNGAKVCVYAPVMEPFGLVALEAMACGTPVIGVRDGGVQESVVHEYTGLLVERDPVRFGKAIQSLLTNPDLASMYGHNAREHVAQNWTWEKSTRTLEKHLVECAGLVM